MTTNLICPIKIRFYIIFSCEGEENIFGEHHYLTKMFPLKFSDSILSYLHTSFLPSPACMHACQLFNCAISFCFFSFFSHLKSMVPIPHKAGRGCFGCSPHESSTPRAVSLPVCGALSLFWRMFLLRSLQASP